MDIRYQVVELLTSAPAASPVVALMAVEHAASPAKNLTSRPSSVGTRPGPVERCYITIERDSSCAGLDWGTACGGLKPLPDCLAAPFARNRYGLGLTRDDSPSNMPLPAGFKQLKAKPGHGRTVVKIYDASGLDVDLMPGPWLQ